MKQKEKTREEEEKSILRKIAKILISGRQRSSWLGLDTE